MTDDRQALVEDPPAGIQQDAPTAEIAEAPEVPPAEEAAATSAAPDALKIEANETAANDLRTAIAEALQGEGLAASVTVSAGDRGVLISVTDDIRNGMFTVGSAVPERALVLAMEKIGRTLAERPGSIRVHGHTDARPYRGNAYDNWRLSTARAHAAQYMLVRGGVDERRITEVAGFADRRLKLPDDPLADANRRIEILLEVPQ
jgi:chemotaxis protein MotB